AGGTCGCHSPGRNPELSTDRSSDALALGEAAVAHFWLVANHAPFPDWDRTTGAWRTVRGAVPRFQRCGGRHSRRGADERRAGVRLAERLYRLSADEGRPHARPPPHRLPGTVHSRRQGCRRAAKPHTGGGEQGQGCRVRPFERPCALAEPPVT